MLNLDKLDPDWTFAQNHAKANRAGKVTAYHQRKQYMTVCRCCLFPIERQPVPICENSKQLQFLGFGFPLFYQFLKNCIILLLLLIASYNALAFRDAIEGNKVFCHSNTNNTQVISHRVLAQTALKCNTPFVEFSKIQASVTYNEQTIRIISFVFLLIGLVYVRNRLMKLQKYYNQRTPSFCNYSILIKGLPSIKGIQNILRQFFREQFHSGHQIMHITLLPHYKELQELRKKKKKIINVLRPFYQQSNIQNIQEVTNLQKQLNQIEKRIQAIAHEFRDMAHKDQIVSEKIICIFNYHTEQQSILKQYPKIAKEIKKRYFGDKYINVEMEQAPDPNQIIWDNINLPLKSRILRILLSYLLSLLTLAAIFVVIFFVLTQKSLHLAHAIQNFQEHQNDYYLVLQYRGAIALVYIAMFFIVIFNKTVLSILFHKFTDLERHSTTSYFEFSFGLKLSFGFFFTTALMTLAVEAIRFKNYYNHLYGVIDEESIMFFMNSFFIPIFWFVHPLRLWKILKRKLNYGKRSLTQMEANKLMEQFPYEMGKRFAEVIQTMWFTFLYSSLIPMGAFIAVLGLIMYYWVDKYNLLRRSSISRQVSGRVIETSLMLLDLIIFFKPLGSLIFDLQLRNQCLPSTIVMLCIGFVYSIIPKTAIIERLNNEQFRKHTISFDDLKPLFANTYNTQHPIIRIINYDKIKEQFHKSRLLIDQSSDPNHGTIIKANPRFFKRIRQRKYRSTTDVLDGNQTPHNLWGSGLQPSTTDYIYS